MNFYNGVDVVEYDGTNADQIVAALKLEEGDVVICTDRPIVAKAMVWRDIVFTREQQS